MRTPRSAASSGGERRARRTVARDLELRLLGASALLLFAPPNLFDDERRQHDEPPGQASGQGRGARVRLPDTLHGKLATTPRGSRF